MRQSSATQRILVLWAGLLPCAFGYIGETITVGGTPTQVTRPDSANLRFYLNNLVVAGAQSSVSGATVITASSNPTAAVESGMATWNSVGSANIRFLALQSTTAGHNSSDCMNVISIGATAADLSILGFVSASSPGVIAATANSYVTASGPVCGGTATGSFTAPAGAIIDSDILLNPYMEFSTDDTANTKDLQAVITHEFGHVFGMNHSGLLGATMYPYAAMHQRHVSWDEKTFAAAYYPSGTKSLGTISGTVTLGSSPVVYGLITLTDLSGGGKTIGALTGTDGTYSVQVPPGVYNVYAEPLNSFIGPTNIYVLPSSTLSSSQATTAFQATFSGGNSTSPPVFTVTAGSSSVANISVVSGATPLAVPFFLILPAGGSGVPAGTPNPTILNSAVALPANQSYDIAIAGPGVNSSVQIPFIGTNVTLVGSPHADSAGISISGNPMIRQTISVGSQTNSTVASLWLIEGSNILPLSGVLDLEPMAPTINNVQDAESARASLTSGQWSAIYGNNLASDTRTWNAAIDFTGGVTTESPLPTSLDGVTVTVNSIPAAVYYVCSICNTSTTNSQINFLTPSGLSPGSATVVVTNGSTASAAFTTTIAEASPSFFYYGAGGNVYPLAVHVSDGNIVGDPAVLPGTEKAHPGETIEMFVNGIAPSTGGVIVPVTAFTQQVTVTAGTTALATSAPYLVAAGEFQVNATLPPTIATGTYQLTMAVPGGSTSTSGVNVILPVGP